MTAAGGRLQNVGLTNESKNAITVHTQTHTHIFIHVATYMS